MLTAQWFVGIDWGSEAPEVCVLNRDGQICERRQVRHTVPDLQAVVDALLTRAQGDPTTVAVGIEVPRGTLLELFVERGFPVYAINPKQLDRFRDRFTTAGAKDDRRDALVIGDSLRTDPQAFRQVRLDHPVIIQLREWSRIDEDLGSELTRVTNQLRDLVYRSAPGLLAVCPAADEPWFWSLLRAAPRPAAQQRLSERRLEHLLRTHRIRRLTARQLREVLPAIFTAPGVADAVAGHLALLLPRVELIATQRREAERQLQRLLEALDQERPPVGDQREHSDIAIVRSMPGIGTRVAARMLAEGSQPLVDRAYHVLRACMGIAPVTKQSGKRRLVSMRYGCNLRLRNAAYHWARSGAQNDPASRAYYQRLRARGHSHGRSLRSVADRLLRILMTLLSRGQIFDPSHGQQSPLSVPAGA
ncbi:MAG TPA: IS110 family transposase [Vicinamibacterales bacterium]|nr:IS110 family transposase [Vicinamibacterales bacterium]